MFVTGCSGRHWAALATMSVAILLALSTSAPDGIHVVAFMDGPTRYTFQDAVYEDYSSPRDAALLTVGAKLGVAHTAPSLVRPDQRPPGEVYVDEPVNVYAFRGVSPESAVAMDTGGKRMSLFVTRSANGKINPEIRQFLKAARAKRAKVQP